MQTFVADLASQLLNANTVFEFRKRTIQQTTKAFGVALESDLKSTIWNIPEAFLQVHFDQRRSVSLAVRTEKWRHYVLRPPRSLFQSISPSLPHTWAP
jgi:hypothetical protein